MHTIGTAGHVDHGKSTLTEALTGIDPDRLAEEKSRGMTIDLGFAWLTLPSGREVSIVDVPGHERFVHNMLAGVGGIDACLLVVAADEGVMPQTREHLDIVTLLDIRAGVVALTKSDLVDDEWARLVEGEVRETVGASSLAGAPIVRVSAAKRTGLDELQAALDAALDRAPERPDLGHARLPIDRAFTMTGFGTVVTGTLSGGSVAVGDELRIRPGGRRVRVRGLQSHRTQVSTAPPGRRVAVNLSGVSVGQAPRGSVLASDGAVVDSRRVDATFRLLPNAPRAIKPGERVAWHSGTAEVVASARYLQTEPIQPGATGWVQWRLSEPVALAKGDPYVVRRLSPPLTIGGGEIVRTTTRRLRRGDSDEIDRLEIAATAEPEEIVLAAVEAHGPLRAAELARRTDLGAAMVAAVAQPALAEGRLASAGGWLWSTDGLAEARARVRAAVEARHADAPTAAGLDRAELRALVDIATDPLTALLDDMALDGTIVLRGTHVALAGHRVELSAEQEAAAQRLLVELDAGGTTPPGLAEAARAADASSTVAAALVAQGRLVQMAPDIAISQATFDDWLARLRELFETSDQVRVGDVRDGFRTSRKFALAFLEYLDAEAITRRVGDARVLLRRAT